MHDGCQAAHACGRRAFFDLKSYNYYGSGFIVLLRLNGEVCKTAYVQQHSASTSAQAEECIYYYLTRKYPGPLLTRRSSAAFRASRHGQNPMSSGKKTTITIPPPYEEYLLRRMQCSKMINMNTIHKKPCFQAPS